MYFNLAFLDEKLYQSLSFDADIKFPETPLYSKKIWILKEYKKQGGEFNLSESEEKPNKLKPNTSYSLQKTFNEGELIVELIKEHRFSDDFDFFAKAEIDDNTGDEELDLIIAQIKDSDFDQSVIVNFILSSESSEKEAAIDEEALDVEEDEKECLPDCQCDCE